MKFKKILALILVFSMCLSFVPTYAFADFDEGIEDAEEYIDEGIEEVLPEEEAQGEPEADALPDEPAEPETQVEEPAEEQEPAEEPAEEPEEEEFFVADEDTFEENYPIMVDGVGVDSYDRGFYAIKEESSVQLLIDSQINNQHVITDNFTLYGNGHTVDVFGEVADPAFTLNGGATFSGDITMNANIAVGGGTLTISEGNFKKVTAVPGANLVGNVTGGFFTEIDDCLIADGYVASPTDATKTLFTVVSCEDAGIEFVAQIGTGADRERFTGFNLARNAALNDPDKVIIPLKAGQATNLKAANSFVKVYTGDYDVVIAAKDHPELVVVSTTDENDVTTFTALPLIAQIGDVKYASFAEAAGDALNSDDVVVMKATPTDSDFYTLQNANDFVKVQLNGIDVDVKAGANLALEIEEGTDYNTYKVVAPVAQIGDTLYGSLRAAVLKAEADDTIILLANDEVSFANGGLIKLGDKNLTIDGKNYTVYGKSEIDLTPTDPVSHMVGFDIDGAGTVTFKDVTLQGFGDKSYLNKHMYTPVYANTTFTGTLNLTNVTIQNFNREGIVIFGGTFAISDSKFYGNNDQQKIGNVGDVTRFQQCVEIRGAATGTITNTTVKTTVADNAPTFDQVGIVSWSTGAVTLSNVNVDVVGVGIEPDGHTITITGENTVVKSDDRALFVEDGGTLNVSAGTYTGSLALDTLGSTFSLSGGYYSVRPEESYCADGYIPVKAGTAENPWTVAPGTIAVRVVKAEGFNETTATTTDGIGYALQDLEVAVGETLNKLDNVLVVLGSVAQTFEVGDKMNVFVAEGGKFAYGAAEGIAVKGTPQTAGYTLYEASEYPVKVVKEGSDPVYYDTIAEALKAANANGGTVVPLAQITVATSTELISDPSKTLKVQWGAYASNLVTITANLSDAVFLTETTEGEITIYGVTPAVAEISNVGYYRTFSEAAEAAAVDKNHRTIILRADIEDAFTMNPELTNFMMVNPQGHKLTVLAPAGYALRKDGQIVVPTRTTENPGVAPIYYSITKPYEVTLDPNNGVDQPITVIAYDDEAFAVPATPTNGVTGYNFGGWRVGTEDGALYTAAVPSAPFTLVAHWDARAFTFYAYSYGPSSTGTGTDLYFMTSFTKYYGEKIDTMNKPVVKPDGDGWTWGGWITTEGTDWIDDDPSIKPPLPDFPWTVDEVLFPSILTATSTNIIGYWTRDKHTVNFDADGGKFVTNEGGTVEKTNNAPAPVDSEIELYPVATPTRAGYVFKTWTYKDGSAVDTKDLPHTVPNEDRTYVAQWEGKEFVVHSYSYGPTSDPATKTDLHFLDTFTLHYGDTLQSMNKQPESPKGEGWTFKGWALADDTQWQMDDPNVTLLPDFPWPVTEATFPTILTATETNIIGIWTRDEHTVNFDAAGGTFKTNKGGYVEKTTNEAAKVDSDIAQYPVEDPVKDFYVFKNWSYAPGEATATSALPKIVPNDDRTYVAQWEGKSFVVHSFSYGAGEETGTDTDAKFLDTITLHYGDELNSMNKKPQSPEGEGWIWKGWSTSSGTQWVNDDPNVTLLPDFPWPVTEATFPTIKTATETNIIGVWERAKHTVSFDPDGGTMKLSNGATTNKEFVNADLKVDADIIYPAAEPTKTGYTFKGWKLGDLTIDWTSVPGKMPNEDQAYVAVWELNEYEITYTGAENATTDMSTMPQSFTVEDGVIVIPDVEANGWKFNGWTSNTLKIKNPTKNVSFDSAEVASNTDLKAWWTNNPYTINYLPQGVDLVTTTDAPSIRYSYAVNSPSFNLPYAEKVGYDFNGWEGTDLTQTTKDVTISTGSYGDREYTAQFTAKKVLVSFDPADGQSPIEYRTIDYGTVADAPAVSLEGYTFKGWKVKEAVSNVPAGAFVEFPYTPAEYFETLSFYGVWEVNKYDLTLYANGGEFTTPTDSLHKDTILVRNVEYGSSINDIATSTAVLKDREGYEFVRWDQKMGDPAPEFMPDGPVDLIAVWQLKVVHVEIDYNDGNATPADNYDVYFGTPINQPTTPSYTGYKLSGYEVYGDDARLDQDGLFSFAFTPTKYYENIKIKLLWTPVSYKIDYNLNGGNWASGTDVVRTYTVTDTDITLPTPEQTGYDFKGWAWASDYNANGDNATAMKPLVIRTSTAKNLAVVALWTPHTYDINYSFVSDGNGATLTDVVNNNTKQYWTVNTPFELAKPTKDDYEFVGWTCAELKDYTVHSTELIIPQGTSGDLNMVGHFRPVTYYVTYQNVPVNVENPNITKFTVEDLPATLTNLECYGYHFDGFTFASGGQILKEIPITVHGNITLKANWTPNIYTVRFFTNGGTEVDDVQLPYLTQIQSPVTTREGYDFFFWSEKAPANQAPYGNIQDRVVFPFTITTDTDLYAYWRVHTNELTFHANTGLFPDGETVKVNESVAYGTSIAEATPSDIPVRDGYKFLGYVDADGNKVEKMPDEALTLYAKWQAEPYTITYELGTTSSDAYMINPETGMKIEPNAEGKSTYTETVIFGEALPTPPVVYFLDHDYEWVEQGYGYYYPSTMPAENLYFKANWLGISSTVTLDANGGTINGLHHFDRVETLTVSGDTDDDFPVTGYNPMPYREGYEFHAWMDPAGNHFDNLPETFPTLDTPFQVNAGNYPNGAVFYYDDGTRVVTTGTNVLTFYIDWEIEKYNVVFDAGEGEFLDERVNQIVSVATWTEVEYGAAIPYPKDPTQEGWVFVGWKADIDSIGMSEPKDMPDIGDRFPSVFSHSPFDFQPRPTLTFTAQWEKQKYTLTLDANGGWFPKPDGTTVDSLVYTEDYLATMTSLTTPTSVGWDFQYYVNEEGEIVDWAEVYTFEADVTLRAIWKIQTVNVTFIPSYVDDKGSMVDPFKYLVTTATSLEHTFNYGDEIVFPVSVTDPGYDFGGWVESGYGFNYPDPAVAIPAEGYTNMTFTGYWVGQTHTVTYLGNGGKFLNENGDEVGSMVVTAKTSKTNLATPTDPELEGYTFKAWYDEDGNIQVPPTTMPAEDMVLTAHYTLNGDKTITFIASEGTPTDAKFINPATLLEAQIATVTNVSYGDEIIFPTTISAKGYTFDGYKATAIDMEGNTVELGKVIPTTMPDYESITFVGTWKANPVTVTFVGNGGWLEQVGKDGHKDWVASYSVTGKVGDPLTFPTNFKAEGFHPHGWVDLNNVHYATDTNLFQVFPAEDAAYAMLWDINEWTYTFMATESDVKILNMTTGAYVGSEGYSVDSFYGADIVFPAENPTREGYDFAGWFESTSTDATYTRAAIPAFGYNYPKQMVDRDMLFVATWAPAKVTLTFDGLEGYIVDDETNATVHSFEREVEVLDGTFTFPSEDKELNVGFHIKGWTESNNATVYAAGTTTDIPSVDTTYTAIWAPNEWSYSFDLGAAAGEEGAYMINPFTGAQVEGYVKQSFYNDTIITPPENPVRLGYDFGGWFEGLATATDQAGEGYGYFVPGNMPNRNMYIHAMWAPQQRTITFNASEGAFINSSGELYDTLIVTGETNATITDMDLTRAMTVAREGYHLLFWRGDDGDHYTVNANGITNSSGATSKQFPAEDLTLTAVWAIDIVTITFQPNKGTITNTLTNVVGMPDEPLTLYLSYGDEIPYPTVERDGFEFDGWCVIGEPFGNRPYVGMAYGRNVPATVPSDVGSTMIIRAMWKGEDYSYTFDADGGKMTTYALDRYVIGTSGVGTGNPAEKPSTHTDVVGFYTVAFNSDIVDAMGYAPQDLFPIPGKTEKKGYHLLGWIDEEGKHYSDVIDLSQTYKFEGKDKTFTAEWEINKYDVTFKATLPTGETSKTLWITNPVTGVATSTSFTIKNVVFATEIPFPAEPTLDGYVFKGWMETKAGLGFGYDPNSMPAEDLVFEAQWTKAVVNLTLDANGGAFVDPLGNIETTFTITAPYKTKLIDPAVFAPTDTDASVMYPYSGAKLDGYTQIGWYGSDGFIYTSLPTEMPAEDLTLTAMWQVNKVVLAFDPDGGKVINPFTQVATDSVIYLEMNYGDTIPYSEIFVGLDGYSFGGWVELTNYGRVLPETVPAKTAITTGTDADGNEIIVNRWLYYKATWDGLSYSIAFDADGGKMETKALDKYLDKSSHTDIVDFYYVVHKFGDSKISVTDLFPLEGKTVKTGYTHVGWIDEEGKHYDDSDLRNYYTEFEAQNKYFTAEWELEKYDVSFDIATPSDAKNGVLIDPNTGLQVSTFTEKVAFGTAIPFPADPTCDGYTFVGWAEAKLGYNYDRTSMPVGPLSFTAQWVRNSVTVSFDANGGLMDTVAYAPNGSAHIDTVGFYSVSGKYNQAMATPTNVNKTGYTLHGWIGSNGKHYDTKDLPKTFPASSVSFVAEWVLNKYEVTFEANPPKNGKVKLINPNTGLATQTFVELVPYDTAIPFPADPTCAGYTFKGWTCINSSTAKDKDQVYTGYNYDKDHMPAYALTFKANWAIEEHTLTFDGNGGIFTDAVGNQYANFSITGESFATFTSAQKAELASLERTGYTFKGWIEADGTPVATPTMIPTEDQTLYAVWNINKYTINVDPNGGKVIHPYTGVATETSFSFEVTYGEAIPYPQISRTGYTFKAWVESKLGYILPATMPAKTLNIKAMWSGVDYLVTFDGNGGEIETAALSVNPASGTHTDIVPSYSVVGDLDHASKLQYLLPISVEREGYDFHGWVDEKGVHYNNEQLPKAFTAADKVFTAVWDLAPFEVSFNPNGGKVVNPFSGVEPQSTTYTNIVYFGEPIPFPADPVREGYTFVNWSCENDSTATGSDQIYTGYNYDRTSMPAFNLVFTAQWELEKHTVTFVGNGGYFTNVVGAQIAEYSLTGKSFTSFTEIDQYWATTLGTIMESVPGHQFRGWILEDGTPYTGVPTAIPAKDLTLYAVFTPYNYFVTYQLPDGVDAHTEAQIFDYQTGLEIDYNATCTFLVKYGDEIPGAFAVWKGHEFLGWVEQYYGYTVPDTMPNRDLVFTAKFEGINYSITFDADGGTMDTHAFNRYLGTDTDTPLSTHTDTVEKYTIIHKFGDPTDSVWWMFPIENTIFKPGYEFKGWVDELGKHYNHADLINYYKEYEAMDKVFTAEWSALSYFATFTLESPQTLDNNCKIINPATLEPVTSFTTMYKFGDTIIYPADPTCIGYEFVGWFDDLGNEYIGPYLGFVNPETMPNKDLHFVAKFKPIDETVVYNANGGTVLGKDGLKHDVLTIEAKTGEKIYRPSVFPEQYGYEFEGWYDHNDEFVAVASLTDVMPAGGETYTARWSAKNVKVLFYACEEDITNGTGTYTDANYGKYKFGDPIVAPIPDPIWEGHEFQGWWYAKVVETTTAPHVHYKTTFLEPVDFSTATVDTLEDIYIIGKWTVGTYTVKYDGNGGLIKGEDGFMVPTLEQTWKYGTKIFKPATPTQAGYKFKGWWDEDAQKIATYGDLPDTMPGKDMFFTARWEVGYNKVVFDANGGYWYVGTATQTSVQIELPCGAEIPVPAEPIYPGQTFLGWKPVVPETMPALEEGVILTYKAQWMPAVYTVHFDSNGAMNSFEDQHVEYLATATDPVRYSDGEATNLYRDGYEFKGWFELQPNGTLKSTKFDFSTGITENVTLVAKWEGKLVKLHWVDRPTYEELGFTWIHVGDFIIRPDYTYYNIQYRTRAGYRLDPDNLWDPEPPTYAEREQYFFLNWIKTLDLMFVANNSVVKITVDEGTTLAENAEIQKLAESLAKEGKKLVWYVNGYEFDQNRPITSNDNLVFLATYVDAPKLTVTFDTVGGSVIAPESVENGKPVAKPADPTKEGFDFVGWTLAGEEYDFSKPVTNDITLTAVWEETQYVVGRYSIQLKNNFVLHYYVDDLKAGTDPADYTISFNGGPEQKLTSTKRNTFNNVGVFTSTELLNAVSVVVKYKGEVVFEDEASIHNYAHKVFDFYGIDNDDVQLVVICKAALNYGAAAQLYANDPGPLANDGNWYDVPGLPIPAGEENSSDPIKGITGGASSVQMGSSVSQLLYANHEKKAKKSDYKFLVDGVETTAEDAGSAYRVRIDDLFVTAINTAHTLTVIYHEGKTDQQTFTYTVSPTSYLYKINNAYPGTTYGNCAYYLYNYYAATTFTDVQ